MWRSRHCPPVLVVCLKKPYKILGTHFSAVVPDMHSQTMKLPCDIRSQNVKLKFYVP
jgi:hypothetical protein